LAYTIAYQKLVEPGIKYSEFLTLLILLQLFLIRHLGCTKDRIRLGTHACGCHSTGAIKKKRLGEIWPTWPSKCGCPGSQAFLPSVRKTE
jgi:hypothetical protein